MSTDVAQIWGARLGVSLTLVTGGCHSQPVDAHRHGGFGMYCPVPRRTVCTTGGGKHANNLGRTLAARPVSRLVLLSSCAVGHGKNRHGNKGSIRTTDGGRTWAVQDGLPMTAPASANI